MSIPPEPEVTSDTPRPEDLREPVQIVQTVLDEDTSLLVLRLVSLRDGRIIRTRTTLKGRRSLALSQLRKEVAYQNLNLVSVPVPDPVPTAAVKDGQDRVRIEETVLDATTSVFRLISERDGRIVSARTASPDTRSSIARMLARHALKKNLRLITSSDLPK